MKLLKLKVKFVIINGVNGLISNGKVIWKKFWKGFVLFIVDVLYKLLGMVFNSFI